MIAMNPVIATPRQPKAWSRIAEVNVASSVPTLANTTKKLVMPVRHRVGVCSTTIGRIGVTPAARPKPTRKRSVASAIQAPVGNKPIAPAQMPQIIVPATAKPFRPKTSPSEPETSEPTIAPIPAQ